MLAAQPARAQTPCDHSVGQADPEELGARDTCSLYIPNTRQSLVGRISKGKKRTPTDEPHLAGPILAIYGWLVRSRVAGRLDLSTFAPAHANPEP
jgi:hypothetical protein